MENYIQLVKNEASPLSIQGLEGLSIGESFKLFFKELALSTDTRLATLSKSVHKVSLSPAEANIRGKKLLYVKCTGAALLVPEGYRPGLANMAAHTKAVTNGVFIITSLKTEASRLYHWLKDIINTGRIDSSFRWTVTDFDKALMEALDFVKGIPENNNKQTYPLGQVYISFEEFFETVTRFNIAASTIGARDTEVLAKELTGVYELGELMVTKIKANDLVLSESAIREVESIVNRFIGFTNLAGAMMTLLNELTAVLEDQVKTISKL